MLGVDEISDPTEKLEEVVRRCKDCLLLYVSPAHFVLALVPCITPAHTHQRPHTCTCARAHAYLHPHIRVHPYPHPYAQNRPI